jgi:hypothetical protein
MKYLTFLVSAEEILLVLVLEGEVKRLVGEVPDPIVLFVYTPEAREALPT